MREWLIQIRKDKNLKQEYIATECGISKSYYSQIECGIRRPSVENAKRLGEMLNFDWVLFFEK